MQVDELGEQVKLLRQSETFQMWQSPDQSAESIQQVEKRVRDRLNRERDRLDEAIIDYNRLVRRRRLSLISVNRQYASSPGE
jgi:Mg-chelatase subunit ChlI